MRKSVVCSVYGLIITNTKLRKAKTLLKNDLKHVMLLLVFGAELRSDENVI